MTKDDLLDMPEVDVLLRAICSLENPDEARALMLDLATPREIADFAQRLEVARLLSAGESYLAVSARTGASSTTVSRVSKCLNGAEGGYRIVLGRLADADVPANPGAVPDDTN